MGLIPRNEKYFETFTIMAREVERGAELLRRLYHEFEFRGSLCEQIKNLEHSCDEITHEVNRKLNQSFITPIDREDIYALAGALDDVMDLIDSAARRTVIYKVERPTEAARRLAEVLVRATGEMVTGVGLLEKGDRVIEHCKEIHRLENEGDTLYHEAIGQLFDEEKDPLRVIKWKEIYETLERGIDKVEDAANVLEAIALKNA
jgi:predicted phosphate transport protein (TIGR00153 family)